MDMLLFSKRLCMTLFLITCSISHMALAQSNVYADVNCDGEVNIADVNAVIDVILGNDSPSIQPSTQSYTVNGVTFNMVHIEGGSFQMGATEGQPVQDGSYWIDKNIPVHQVTLSSYNIGQTEVTLELWRAVMGSVPTSYGNDYGYAVLYKLPVVHISWNDCQNFILKLNELTGKNFRLPTEAEWEYAARGGKKSNGYIYAGSNNAELVAWCCQNSSNSVHSVATKNPNELNIYDMSGNATEYCSDIYGPYSPEPQTNPTGPTTSQYDVVYRVHRGGDAEGGGSGCAIALRGLSEQNKRNDFRGFRLAL